MAERVTMDTDDLAMPEPSVGNKGCFPVASADAPGGIEWQCEECARAGVAWRHRKKSRVERHIQQKHKDEISRIEKGHLVNLQLVQT